MHVRWVRGMTITIADPGQQTVVPGKASMGLGSILRGRQRLCASRATTAQPQEPSLAFLARLPTSRPAAAATRLPVQKDHDR